MKTITYDYEKMVRAVQLLSKISIQGIDQARAVAEIGDILDSGKLGKIILKENKEDGVGQETLRSD